MNPRKPINLYISIGYVLQKIFIRGFSTSRNRRRGNKQIVNLSKNGQQQSCGRSGPPGVALAWLLLALCAPPGYGQGDPGYQSHQAIRDRVEQYVRTHPALQSFADVQVRAAALESRLTLARCSSVLEAFLPPGAKLPDNPTVGIRCNTGRSWTLYVPVQLDAYVDVPVTARPLSRGTILGSGDLQIARHGIKQLPAGYLVEIHQALGKQLSRSLVAGEVVTLNVIAAPRLVRRGQLVGLLAQGPGIDVRSSGKALSDGVEGDRVKVQNPSTKRVVEGVVLADGTVRVN